MEGNKVFYSPGFGFSLTAPLEIDEQSPDEDERQAFEVLRQPNSQSNVVVQVYCLWSLMAKSLSR